MCCYIVVAELAKYLTSTAKSRANGNENREIILTNELFYFKRNRDTALAPFTFLETFKLQADYDVDSLKSHQWSFMHLTVGTFLLLLVIRIRVKYNQIL